jgi:hypothetical protein
VLISIVKRLYKIYAPLFNEFILISVDLDESEAKSLITWMKLTKTLNAKPYGLIY